MVQAPSNGGALNYPWGGMPMELNYIIKMLLFFAIGTLGIYLIILDAKESMKEEKNYVTTEQNAPKTLSR